MLNQSIGTSLIVTLFDAHIMLEIFCEMNMQEDLNGIDIYNGINIISPMSKS